MNTDPLTQADSPNALAILSEARQLLQVAVDHSRGNSAALAKVLSLIEQVQDEVRHGMDRALAPIRREQQDHERRISALEGVVQP